jgi:hypothetical protein
VNAALRVERSGENNAGPCGCCGGETRTVWGYVHRGDEAVAAYFVAWTRGQVGRHGANIDLVLGEWGDRTGAQDRYTVSLAFRRTDRGPAFMVIDSAGRPVASSDLAANHLGRADVIETPVAADAFAIVDAIWLQDDRVSELAAS